MSFLELRSIVAAAGLLSAVALSSTPGVAALEVNEDAIMRRDDSIDAHNRRVGAEIARERTRTELVHAEKLYQIAVKLEEVNASYDFELYDKLVGLLNARVADRVANHVVVTATADEAIGELRRSWRSGSAPVNLETLAKLMVQKRESALALAEASLADFRQIARARKALADITEQLARSQLETEENRSLAVTRLERAVAEVAIWIKEVEAAKIHLQEAREDLRAVTSR
jgi:hypothetical protein